MNKFKIIHQSILVDYFEIKLHYSLISSLGVLSTGDLSKTKRPL